MSQIPELSINDFDFLKCWTLDSNLSVLSFNNQAARLGDSPFLGLSHKDSEALKKFIVSGPKEGDAGLVLTWITKEQPHPWLKWRVRMKGDLYYLLAVEVSDIKRRELYLEQILNALPDMVLVKGEASRIEWANKSFQEYYGLTNEQLHDMIDAPYVEPDLTMQYIVDDKKVWDSKKPLLVECEPVVRHDGIIRKFETMKSPLFDSKQQVAYTVGVSRDITDKIDQETKSINTAKMAAIGELAGGMAHEINNPIAVISGKAYIMKRLLNRGAEIDKAQILEALETIQNHAERITRVISILRKISVDTDFEDFGDTHLQTFLLDTLLLTESKIHEKGIQLTVEIPADFSIEVRSAQLSHAILNILNNAIDATENLPRPWIKVSAFKSADDTVTFRIQDSGRGVSEDILGKIMQPFFTTKEVGKGAGLGLTFAQSVAKNHHGFLKQAREVSPSCFDLVLPIHQKK